MKRSKLQQLVRESLTPTAATEGFLDDTIKSIKSVFSGSKSDDVLTKDEVYKGRLELHSAKNRLQKTILNPSWLKSVELVDRDLSEGWALPGVDYKGLFDPNAPIAHMHTAFSDLAKTIKDYADVLHTYCNDSLHLYRELIKGIGAAGGDRNLIKSLLTDTDEKFSKFTSPIKHLNKHEFDLLGNHHYSLVDGKPVRTVVDCKAETISTLTKDQMSELGKILIHFIDLDPEVLLIEAQNYLDWDVIKPDLLHAGCSRNEIDNVFEMLTESTFIRSIRDVTAWEDPVINILMRSIGISITQSMRWIKDSVK